MPHGETEAEVLKEKSICVVIVSFAPFFLVLLAETGNFRTPLSLGGLIPPTVIQILLLAVLWHRMVRRPAKEFLKAINRAIDGDFCARFSCDDGNATFKKLSGAFNALMGSVEKRMKELSENRLLQNQLYENEKIYRSALELSCERILEADLSHNRIAYGLAKYSRAFPFLHTEMYDSMIRSIAENAVHPDDSSRFYQSLSRENLLEAFRRPDVKEVTLEYRLKTPEPVWYSASVVCLNSGGRDSLKIIGYVKNIDARKKQEIAIYKRSQKDGLTGLYNKTATQTMIEAFLAGKGRNGRHAVVMADIDNFKNINDTFGHAQGDLALAQVAQKLRGLFRSSDIAGRVGGDEFLILVKNIGSEPAFLKKLKAVGKLFHTVRLEKTPYRISGSVGAAFYPDNGTTYDALYKRADCALYHSKADGKDRFSLYGGGGTPRPERAGQAAGPG